MLFLYTIIDTTSATRVTVITITTTAGAIKYSAA